MDAIYIGTISAVWAPNHRNNSNKYQYEYAVSVQAENYATIKVLNCIKADSFGGFDDFNDEILSVGNSVLVSFPRESTQIGFIMGAIRSHNGKTEADRGVHWRRRFNKFEMGIDKNYNWSAKSDSGPNAHIMVDKIILDDSQGQKITLDKNTKTITVEAELWTIDIRKDVKMTVGGNVTATVGGNAKLDVTGNADISVKGALTAKVDKDASIEVKGNLHAKVDKGLNATVKGKAKIKANTIALNGELGRVLTTATDPLVDMITGVPSTGVANVKAGGE